MVKKIISGIVCCVLFAMSACVKQTNYPLYPILTSITVSQTLVNAYFAQNNGSDSLAVTMSFTDGEGGIGPVAMNTDPDSIPTSATCNHAYDSLIISDPFYNVYYYEYHASHISTDSCLNSTKTAYIPDNPKSLSVAGTIQVYPTIECPATGNTDTIIFSFFIKDRAGKVSNHIWTQPIIITCQ